MIAAPARAFAASPSSSDMKRSVSWFSTNTIWLLPAGVTRPVSRRAFTISALSSLSIAPRSGKANTMSARPRVSQSSP